MQELQLLGERRILVGLQGREVFRDHLAALVQHGPDLLDDVGQGLQVPVLGLHDPFPVPLVDVRAVIVIEEVILAHGAHVGADALALFAFELLQRPALPLGRGLDNLSFDTFLESEPARKVDGRARAVAVEVVVHAAVLVDDQRYLDHLQVQFLAQVLLDEILELVERFHAVHRTEQRCIVGGQAGVYFRVGADAGACEVSFLVGHSDSSPSVGLESWEILVGENLVRKRAKYKPMGEIVPPDGPRAVAVVSGECPALFKN